MLIYLLALIPQPGKIST